MPRKIKKKPEPKPSNEGKIILIVTGILLAVIAVFLIILAIVQNVGKKNEDTDKRETSTTVSQISQTVSSTDTSTSSTVERPSEAYMDSVTLDMTKTYYADINVKDYGKITVELNYEAAPTTVRNFIYLTESGFYNGLTFHRIMDGFMMQGGDPQGNGLGGSEHNIYGEFSANGWTNSISHTKGVISMARNKYDMNSASSQFFIVQSDDHTGSLDGQYAAFGHVTEGLELVDKICHDAKPTDNNGTIPADQQPVIESITIRAVDK